MKASIILKILLGNYFLAIASFVGIAATGEQLFRSLFGFFVVLGAIGVPLSLASLWLGLLVDDVSKKQ